MIRRYKSFLVKLEREQAQIAKHRDKLRDLWNEIENLMFDCDEAIDALATAKMHIDHAADELSKTQ